VELERDGVRLAYDTVGAGPTVVLHMGGLGDGEAWREYLPQLFGFRVVLLDHRGRGDSDRPARVEQHAMSEYVDDVIALIDDLGEDRVGLVGYSMGAQVGYAVAAAAPERIFGLVGMGAVGPPDADPAGELAYAEALRANGTAWLLDEIEREEGLVVPSPVRPSMAGTDVEQFALSVEALSEWNAWGAFPRIVAPTLLLAQWLPDLGHVGAFLAVDHNGPLIAAHLRRAAATP
jgi:pimeloyl-ACP methyl ester carboxylesterase